MDYSENNPEYFRIIFGLFFTLLAHAHIQLNNSEQPINAVFLLLNLNKKATIVVPRSKSNHLGELCRMMINQTSQLPDSTFIDFQM